MSHAPLAPFDSDADYIQEEVAAAKVVAAKLEAERKLREALRDEAEGDAPWLHRSGRATSRVLQGRMLALGTKLAEMRSRTDARMEVHRADLSRPALGIDRLSRQYGLTAEERLVLVFLTIPCIGRELADDVLGSLPCYFNGLSVGNLIQLAGATAVVDWLRLRRLFHAGASLRRHGLVFLNQVNGEVGPDLVTAEAKLSVRAFCTIVGDPGIMTEAELPGRTSPSDDDGSAS